MKLGQRMMRLEDGAVGSVELVVLPGNETPEKRIVYIDRGEKRIAPRNEKWVSTEPQPLPLRAEEKFLIAMWADKALRAYEKNEPLKTWEQPKLSDEPYDNELVMAVLAYLSRRELEHAQRKD